VAGLGDLLRRVLDGVAQQEVPLQQELDFIRNYLDIEQVASAIVCGFLSWQSRRCSRREFRT
jgi:hypothetical protein